MSKANDQDKSFYFAADMNSEIFCCLRMYPLDVQPVRESLAVQIRDMGRYNLGSINIFDSVFKPVSLNFLGRLLKQKYVNTKLIHEDSFREIIRLSEKRINLWFDDAAKLKAHMDMKYDLPIKVLQTLNICHELNLSKDDFNAKKKAALQQIANLDIESSAANALKVKNDRWVSQLGVVANRLVQGLSDLEYMDTPSQLQELVIKSLIAINKAYITALTKRYGLDKPLYPLDSYDWIDWHPFKTRLDEIPTTIHHDGVYCKKDDVLKALHDYASIDLKPLILKQKEHIEEFECVVGRMMYIHNYPHKIENRQAYMQKKLNDPHYACELFELYACGQQDFLNLLKSLPKEYSHYPYPSDQVAFSYIYKRSPEIKGYLKDIAILFDWDIEVEELKEKIRKDISNYHRKKEIQKQYL